MMGQFKVSILVESMKTTVQTGVRPHGEVTLWVTLVQLLLPTQELTI